MPVQQWCGPYVMDQQPTMRPNAGEFVNTDKEEGIERNYAKRILKKLRSRRGQKQPRRRSKKRNVRRRRRKKKRRGNKRNRRKTGEHEPIFF